MSASSGALSFSGSVSGEAVAPTPSSTISAAAQRDGVALEAAATNAASALTEAEITEQVKEDWEIQRDHHKQQADQAFRMGGFRTAIDNYSKAIALDPEFVVAYSNRSAAYLKNSEKSKALKDAEQVVKLDPKLAKGHSRLAAALHSLRRYEQALDAYRKVLSLDPANSVAQKGLADCQGELDKIKQHHREQEEQEKKERDAAAELAREGEEEINKQSHNVDKEEEEEEADDLLNDFFADVEEVTKKNNKESSSETASSAKNPPGIPTNAVKNEKQILGTSTEQMDRLLKPNFEWRNLNPYYVLQLPHTSNEDDVARRYKALSLLLHPDKNGGSERAQQAFDEVKKAKTVLMDENRAKHAQQLTEEGLKQAKAIYKQQQESSNQNKRTLEEIEEAEVMRIFAQIEQKRREVAENERKFEQRTQQQEDDEERKARQERKFDKNWRKEERVDKRVGNWRDFAGGAAKKRKKSLV